LIHVNTLETSTAEDKKGATFGIATSITETQIMNDVTENLVETSSCGAEALNKARAALAGARETLIHAAPVEKARAGMRAMDDYVHKSPWSLIGGVAVIAIAVGLLLRRR
jgi:ElaB/YqjD/DUF883 family membrane-anchored ribosome-binding protein